MLTRRLLLLLPLLLLTAHAEDPFLAAVRQRITSIQPFSVEFTHQVFIEGEREVEESGLILFRDYRNLKWEYRKPETKIFILKGEEYQFYQKEDRQLIRGKITSSREQLIWHFLFAQEKNRAIATDTRKRTITIRNPSPDDFIDLEITFSRDNLPEKAVQKDVTGIENVFLFNRYRRNITISLKELELKTPPDTEVIEEIANK